MDKFFVIIVAYNGLKWLPKCLTSTKPYPVIIVDNNSTDGTTDYIKSQHPEIILFEQKKNLGFGQANNIGISYALNQGAEYVFLLNQDAYFVDDCLCKMLALMKGNEEFGILSPIHLNGNGTKLDENFSNYLIYSKNSDFYSDYVLNKTKQKVYEVPFVNAAGWLISRNCLETVGGFDPIFFHYGEDENYCQRLKFFDFKIGVAPNFFIKHDRQFRNKLNLQLGSKKYWEKIARSHKIKGANINKSNIGDLEAALQNRKSAVFKSFLKFRFDAVKSYKRELEMLEENIPLIKRSLEINKKPGAHYLNLK
ncbi:glycosyltransferase family 2 protein [Christiangramia marina]|uniref:glycosyltransferase family 2 protein n=1 Tax=Christiangramia marina TaxID=409436 RepID=UPI003AA90A26